LAEVATIRVLPEGGSLLEAEFILPSAVVLPVEPPLLVSANEWGTGEIPSL
jgi:hypothetical protein